jgi:hypothetical protein
MKYVKITDMYEVSYIVSIDDQVASDFNRVFFPCNYTTSSPNVEEMLTSTRGVYVRSICSNPQETIENARTAECD